MKRIIVSAPGKLMLLGEHAVVYNHSCLVTAVDQRMKVAVEVLDIPEFQLEAPDVNVTGYKKPLTELGVGDIPKGAKFVEIAVKNILDFNSKSLVRHSGESSLTRQLQNPSFGDAGQASMTVGVRVTTTSEFSSQFGFGSSSASTVCAIKAVSELLGLNLSPKEIFDLSYKTVLDIQGKGSGFDVASAVYGGTLYFVTGGKIIEPLSIESLPLVVGYSGIKADTVILMSRVKKSFTNRQNRLDEIYNGIEVLVNQGKEAIVKEDWKRLGKLMNKNQEYLQDLGVSIEKLDNMIKASLENGAYGAKLSGAGGGDCMIAVASEDKKQTIEEAINAAGGEVINVGINAEGVRIDL